MARNERKKKLLRVDEGDYQEDKNPLLISVKELDL